MRKKKGSAAVSTKLAEVFESDLIKTDEPTKFVLEIANSKRECSLCSSMCGRAHNAALQITPLNQHDIITFLLPHRFRHQFRSIFRTRSCRITQAAAFDCGATNSGHSRLSPYRRRCRYLSNTSRFLALTAQWFSSTIIAATLIQTSKRAPTERSTAAKHTVRPCRATPSRLAPTCVQAKQTSKMIRTKAKNRTKI